MINEQTIERTDRKTRMQTKRSDHPALLLPLQLILVPLRPKTQMELCLVTNQCQTRNDGNDKGGNPLSESSPGE